MNVLNSPPFLIAQGSVIDGFKMGNLPAGILGTLLKEPLLSYKGVWGYCFPAYVPAGSIVSIDHTTGHMDYGDLSADWDITKYEGRLMVDANSTFFGAATAYSAKNYPTLGWYESTAVLLSLGYLYRKFNPNRDLSTTAPVANNTLAMFMLLQL